MAPTCTRLNTTLPSRCQGRWRRRWSRSIGKRRSKANTAGNSASRLKWLLSSHVSTCQNATLRPLLRTSMAATATLVPTCSATTSSQKPISARRRNGR